MQHMPIFLIAGLALTGLGAPALVKAEGVTLGGQTLDPLGGSGLSSTIFGDPLVDPTTRSRPAAPIADPPGRYSSVLRAATPSPEIAAAISRVAAEHSHRREFAAAGLSRVDAWRGICARRQATL